jgi:hypothetical protein
MFTLARSFSPVSADNFEFTDFESILARRLLLANIPTSWSGS